MDNSKGRPVYILGAGFSKAINAGMPLTDDLGRAVAEKFQKRTKRELTYKSGKSFEDWLSITSQDMPFLLGYENLQRAADTQLLLSLIAETLDELMRDIRFETVPLWLRQLIDIWNIEHAKIITFNYDTLLEKAINSVCPIAFHNITPYHPSGDQVVFPRPPAEPGSSYDELSTQGISAESMQILKLHGSLNWYWASDDPLGSTLRRVPVLSDFDKNDGDVNHSVQGLEKFLIPPLSGKSKYYHPYLTRSFWRDAYNAIRDASSISLIGYSLPRTDQIVAQLLAIPKAHNPLINIVDLVPGNCNEESVTNRAKQATEAEDIKIHVYPGESCIQDYVTAHVNDLAASVELGDEIIGSERNPCVLLSARVKGTGFLSSVDRKFMTLRRRTDEIVPSESVESGQLHEMPASEVALNRYPRGYAPALESYLHLSDAIALLKENKRLVINQYAPDETTRVRRLVAVDAVCMHIDSYDNVILRVVEIE